MNKIITLTLNPCIDKTIWVDRLIPEKKLKAKHPEDEPGGGGINVSRAIKYLDGESTAIYLSGSYNGQYLTELIKAESIDFIDVPITLNTRMSLMLIDESNLQEYRIGLEGPIVTKQELNNLVAVIEQQKDYDFLVATNSNVTEKGWTQHGLSTNLLENNISDTYLLFCKASNSLFNSCSLLFIFIYILVY